MVLVLQQSPSGIARVLSNSPPVVQTDAAGGVKESGGNSSRAKVRQNEMTDLRRRTLLYKTLGRENITFPSNCPGGGERTKGLEVFRLGETFWGGSERTDGEGETLEEEEVLSVCGKHGCFSGRTTTVLQKEEDRRAGK